MDKMELFAGLIDAMVSLEKEKVLHLTQKALEMDLDPLDIIDHGLLPGLTEIGRQFENEEVFLPELMLSAMVFQKAMAILQPRIQAQGAKSRKKGTVVIGTVKGDMHYIGKNIVRLLLEINGFEVHDLGVDVDPLKFVQKAREVEADIIALSALLTTTLVGQRDVIEALVGLGVRDRFKVLVGGGAVTKKWSEDIKADGYAETAYAAVEMAAFFVRG
ncbi:MAG: corrinoid protein [Deltaproteobacteria bacterium]|nr:corrinoid protein [Deltaproteobacteria bacterium]